jgi:hypothetical protein
MPAAQTPINYYELLGVLPSATLDEIKTGYRARIAYYHPDRNRSAHAGVVRRGPCECRFPACAGLRHAQTPRTTPPRREARPTSRESFSWVLCALSLIRRRRVKERSVSFGAQPLTERSNMRRPWSEESPPRFLRSPNECCARQDFALVRERSDSAMLHVITDSLATAVPERHSLAS